MSVLNTHGREGYVIFTTIHDEPRKMLSMRGSLEDLCRCVFGL